MPFLRDHPARRVFCDFRAKFFSCSILRQLVAVASVDDRRSFFLRNAARSVSGSIFANAARSPLAFDGSAVFL